MQDGRQEHFSGISTLVTFPKFPSSLLVVLDFPIEPSSDLQHQKSTANIMTSDGNDGSTKDTNQNASQSTVTRQSPSGFVTAQPSRNQYAKQGWGSRMNFQHSYGLKPGSMLLVNTLRFIAVAHLDKGTTMIGRRAIEYSMRLLKQTRRRKGNDRYGNRCDKGLAF